MSIQSYITQIHIYYCISNNKSLISPIGHTDQDGVKHKKEYTQDSIIIVNLHGSIDQPDSGDGEEQDDKDREDKIMILLHISNLWNDAANVGN